MSRSQLISGSVTVAADDLLRLAVSRDVIDTVHGRRVWDDSGQAARIVATVELEADVVATVNLEHPPLLERLRVAWRIVRGRGR